MEFEPYSSMEIKGSNKKRLKDSVKEIERYFLRVAHRNTEAIRKD